MGKTLKYTFKSAHVAYFAGVASGHHGVSAAGAMVILAMLGLSAVLHLDLE